MGAVENIEQTTVPLGRVRRDGGTQMRDSISEATVIEYAEHMEDGAKFPAVTVFYDGTDYWLADGFHRCAAYERAGITEIPAEVLVGTHANAVAHAIKANATNGRPRTLADLRRAYLKAVEFDLCKADDSKGVAAALLCSTRHGQRLTQAAREERDRKRDAEIERLAGEGKSNYEVAAEIGVAESTVRNVKGAQKRTLSEIAQPDPLLKAQQQEVMAGAKEIRSEKTKEMRAQRVEKIAEISQGNATLNTEQLFPVIYADPPWRYDYSETESRAIENQYPTMTIEDICALKIPATEDAILFLWTTSPKLQEGLRVVKEWGFNYRTCAVWDKQKIGMGYYFRQQHEILLVATRGSIPAPEPSNRPGSVFSFKRGEHSSKPHEVAEIIERMYPEFSKLEMFCRSPRAGWSVWGNQSYAA
jgi:N6-adenosine-specific RNA methylase IME4